MNANGTVTIYAVTSTVSANGDQGADPNKLVAITDTLANTTAAGASSEQFTVVKAANYGEVLRGVAFTPGSTRASAGNLRREYQLRLHLEWTHARDGNAGADHQLTFGNRGPDAGDCRQLRLVERVACRHHDSDVDYYIVQRGRSEHTWYRAPIFAI